MVRVLAILSVTFVALINQTTLNAGSKRPKRLISISLEAVDRTVKIGTVPKLRLMIRNDGRTSERVIDLRGGRRPDLQDTYYDVDVTGDGGTILLPRAISDPGPVSDKDFLILRPSEQVMFQLTRFATSLEELAPGRYRLRIRFWQDPWQSSTTSLFSPYAELIVEK